MAKSPCDVEATSFAFCLNDGNEDFSSARSRQTPQSVSRKSIGVWPRIIKWRCVNNLLHVLRSPQKGNGGKIGQSGWVREFETAFPSVNSRPHRTTIDSRISRPAHRSDKCRRRPSIYQTLLFQPPRQARPSTRLLIQMRIEFSFKAKGIWVYKRTPNACKNSILTPTI